MTDVAASMSSNTKSLSVRDWAFPFVLGVISAFVCAKWGHVLAELATKNVWKLDQTYTAGFGFLAVTTGFLATFYATLQTATDGFVQRIRITKGHTLTKFLTLTKRTIVLGFVVALLSVPMMVATPVPQSDPLALATLASSIWFGATVWAVASFYSVASVFFMLLETPASRRHGGG